MKVSFLTLNSSTSDSLKITLIQEVPFSIGRDEKNNHHIMNQKISSTHLTLIYKKNEFILTDYSSNGTYLNNQKIGKGNSALLKNGDVIHLLPQSKVKETEIIGWKFITQDQQELINEKNTQEAQITKIGDNSDKITEEVNPQQPQNQPLQATESKSNIITELNWLEDQIMCTICSDYIFQAVAITPCNHHFCGACLSNWLTKKTHDCPNCRKKITGIMKAHIMNNLVESYLKMKPEAKRTEQLEIKMKTENVIYQNPEKYENYNQQQIQPQKKQAINIQYYEENDEDEEGDEDEEDEKQDEEYLSNEDHSYESDEQKQGQYNAFKQQLVQQPLIGQLNYFGQPFMGFNNNQQNLNQNYIFGYPQQLQRQIFFNNNNNQALNPQLLCKSCNGKMWRNYQCTDNQVHIGCASCGRLMPKRQLNEEENIQLQMFCSICQAYHCQFYYGDCEKKQLQKFMLVKELKHQMVLNYPFINTVEHDRILKHLEGKPQTIIFDFMMDHYISKGFFYFQQNKATYSYPLKEINVKLTPESPICWLCHRKLINYIAFRYVQCLKFDEALFMNPDCWYGVNCRDQHRSVNHAKQYNHCCEQTKFE